MSQKQQEITLPSVSIVVPSTASTEDAVAEASERISLLLKGASFEVVAVDLIEEGELQTSVGVVVGKRFMISFRRSENVVFLHPDYHKIMMEEHKKRMRNRNENQRSQKRRGP